MVCGGFSCSKHALAALNVLYLLVSIILIIIAGVGRGAAIVTSLALVGGIIACGVFLFIIAIIGLIGAIKHHQVLLFFYMIILFLLFLLQFSLACACLAVNSSQKDALIETGWKLSTQKAKSSVQFTFDCCGFKDQGPPSNDPLGHPPCSALNCCKNYSTSPICAPSNATLTEDIKICATCYDTLKEKIYFAFSISGGIGLFFSFTEILGVWLSMRYRNQKDPRANPSAFL